MVLCGVFTMADKSSSKYAGVVTSQTDPNAVKREEWTNVVNAKGHVNSTSAYANYTQTKVATHYSTKTTYDKNGKEVKSKVADKWKTVDNHPWTLAFHNFDLNIPSNAKIKKITFTAKVKCDKNLTVQAPICDFRVNAPSSVNLDDNTDGKKTGWHKSHYFGVSSKKLSTSWQEIKYVMDYDDIKKANVTPAKMNLTNRGCDLVWHDLEKITGKYNSKSQITGKVYVAWVRCKVVYDVPDYKIDIKNPIEVAKIVGKVDKTNLVDSGGTASSPFHVEPYEWFDLVVKCRNTSVAKGSDYRYIVFDVPWASEIRRLSGDGTFSYNETLGKYVWRVPVGSNADYTLNIQVKSSSSDVSKLKASLHTSISPLSNVVQSTSYYYIANLFDLDLSGEDVGYCNIEVIPTSVTAYELSCVDIKVHGVVSNTTATVTVDPSDEVDLPIGRDGFFTLSSVTSDGTVDILSQSGNTATLQVPFETEFIAILKYCFYPLTYDTIRLTVNTSMMAGGISVSIPVEDSHTFIPEVSGGDIVKVTSHRVFSEIESDVVIIPMTADEIDSSMVMTPCQINMSVWEDLDYIGCVPLEHLHFDPKSTYKDTLLNSTYKNKRYMGKKLATDEDITLNVRLHPQQVTTIQGLIDMDKPIPINANHRCFEGDSLNHRGWAEIYSIKTEETNPHWYKCDIDVKYLTHNLKTRFNITRGKNVDDYPIPSVLSEVFSSGDNLSDTSEDKFFDVETDGTFMYLEDYEDEDTHEVTTVDDEERNFFSIDNGEYIHIQTHNPLSHDSQVQYTWSATILPEHRENNVSKIIKLIDNQGNSVFEYEYNSLEFITDTNNNIEEIRGTVIYRVDDETYEEKFTYRYDDGSELDEDDVENVISDGQPRYGSTLKFIIHNNLLDIIDEGFNGSEVYFKDIALADKDYYYVVEWRNNNLDGDTATVDCTVDFQVQDTVLSTTYVNKFGKLLISPFPVADKKLLFTRNAEEGTIYYYEYEEGKEFSYIVEPYYQYQNGTDLIGDNTSIFNLNYGYEIVYIQNGLVRLGFNRVDDKGHMYLGKYDPQSEEYVTTNILHLGKYTDLNVNALSDDKIEIQASDSTFTIYRGHPYIKINHADEDIYIDTTFNRVWAEQVGVDKSVDLPAYWDLLNTANLLPPSIGGVNTLDPSAITVEKVQVDDNTDINMSWYNPPSTVYNDEEVTFYIQSDYLTNYSDEIYIDGNECSFGSYQFEKVSDDVPATIDVVSIKQIVQSSESTKLNATVKDWSNKGVSNQTVYFYEAYEPTTLDIKGDKSIIQSGEEIHLTATLKDEDGSRIKGETIYFYERIE